MLKKEIAGSFLKLAASGNVVEAYSRYVDHDFFHVELWDLGQELMKDSPNLNGAF